MIMMINKYNRVFFAPGETTTVDDEETPVKINTNSNNSVKKKRNLVTLSTPLIIKITPYEKEKTVIDDTSGEETTETDTYHKTNKSFNQILDAYLMDRTIKLYYEEEQLPTLIDIMIDTVQEVMFKKLVFNNKSVYRISLTVSDSSMVFFSASPDSYMTTELENGNNETEPIPGNLPVPKDSE